MAIEIVSFPIKNGDFHQRVFFFTILIAWNESNQLTLVSSIMATIWVSFHHLSTWVQRRKDKGGAFLKWWYPNKAGWFGKSDFLFHGWLFGAPPRLRKPPYGFGSNDPSLELALAHISSTRIADSRVLWSGVGQRCGRGRHDSDSRPREAHIQHVFKIV